MLLSQKNHYLKSNPKENPGKYFYNNMPASVADR